MIAIFKKEFMSYMRSVTGWLFMAITICLFGLYASVYNLRYGSTYVAYVFNATLILFFITIPLLTMRSMAEERRQKTDQMLLTSPVSVGKIVMGKFLAMAAVFAIPMLLMCCLPLYLSTFGDVPMAENFVAVLAFTLYGLSAIAVGLFISSLTENVIISAVLTFLALFATYMMQGLESLVSTEGNIVTKIMGWFDFASHYGSMIQTASDVSGNTRLTTIFDLSGVLYFLTVIALMLFFTAQSVLKRRYSVSVRHFALGAYSAASTAAVIIIAAAVNIGVGLLPSEYTSIDVTANKLYGITEQSQAIVKSLEDDVNIYVYAPEDSADSVVKQTLEKYKELSEHISVEYIDPNVNPSFMESYTSDSVSTGSIVVSTDKRSKVIEYSDMYELEYDYSTYTQSVTGYDGEGQLTSAISYCTSDDMPKLYFITGHGEYSFDSGFLTAIEKENIDYETISLMEYDSIPDDAECIIIHAPENDFSSDDADKVIDYLNGGGKAVITSEYVTEPQENLDRILAEFGLELERGIIAENSSSGYYQSPFFLLPTVASADETSGLTGQHTYIIAPYAEAVIVPEEAGDALAYEELLRTTDAAVLKTDMTNIQTYAKEDGDIEGPFCIGVKAQKELDRGIGTLYVFTSSQMFTDYFDSAVSGSNKQLFSNIMGTVANHEVSVSIPVKSYDIEWLTIPTQTANIFEAVFMILVPLAFLAAGIGIWAARRRK